MSLQKNALCRGDARSDLRCYALQQFRESGLEVLLRSLYPSLMALHQLDATVFLLSLSLMHRVAPSRKTPRISPRASA